MNNTQNMQECAKAEKRCQGLPAYRDETGALYRHRGASAAIRLLAICHYECSTCHLIHTGGQADVSAET